MNRIAFSLPDVGLREIRGTAHVEDGFLVLTVNDSFLGMADETKRVIEVAPQALANLYIKRKRLKNLLVLEPRSAQLLELIPGEHVSAVELRVKGKYRRQLEKLVDEFHRLPPVPEHVEEEAPSTAT
jgi:hypothetical protein